MTLRNIIFSVAAVAAALSSTFIAIHPAVAISSGAAVSAQGLDLSAQAGIRILVRLG